MITGTSLPVLIHCDMKFFSLISPECLFQTLNIVKYARQAMKPLHARLSTLLSSKPEMVSFVTIMPFFLGVGMFDSRYESQGVDYQFLQPAGVYARRCHRLLRQIPFSKEIQAQHGVLYGRGGWPGCLAL